MEERKDANRQKYKPLFNKSIIIYIFYFNTTVSYRYSVVNDNKNASVFAVCA